MDQINMNAFNKIKEKKHTGKVKETEKPNRDFKMLKKDEIIEIEKGITRMNIANNIKANESNVKVEATKVVSTVTRSSKVSASPSIQNKKSITSNSKITSVSKVSSDKNKMPKIINSNLTSAELNVQMHNNNLVVKDNSTGVTTIAGQYRDSNNEIVTASYNVKAVKGNEPTVKWDQLAPQQNVMSGKEKAFFVDTVKNNKLTFGTTTMMNNEVVHAKEAIDSGIYISWESRGIPGVACIRIGTNSICICGHGFPNHDKVVGKKKFSSKCNSCKCRAFSYIPTFPEEIGEYWIPYQKNFSYKTYRVKCKCKHGWDDHSVERSLGCKKCGCYTFESNFCCVVCDKFWQDHETVYELEHERLMAHKPIGQEFIPFAEVPEIFSAVYNGQNAKAIGDNSGNK